GARIVRPEPEGGRIDQQVGGADLVCHTQPGGAEAVYELGGAMRRAVEHIDARGAGLEEGPGGRTCGAAGAEQQHADTHGAPDERGGGYMDAFDVRVVTVHAALTGPERVARAGAHHCLARTIDSGACPCLVWHGDVAATAGLCDRAYERGDVGVGATQRHVHGIDPVLVERGIDHVRRARMGDGVAEERIDASAGADRVSHGARISSSRSSARSTRRSICPNVRRYGSMVPPNGSSIAPVAPSANSVSSA